MSAPLLEVRGRRVDVATESGIRPAVRGLDLRIERGQTLGVVGESGSGKTMAVLALMGILPPAARVSGGEFRWQGEEVSLAQLHKRRGTSMTMVFQNPSTSLNPLMRIGDQITEGLVRLRGFTRAAAEARAVELLALVGIPAPDRRMRQYPHELSGGMRQRVMIAVALGPEPELLIADEPTTALDVTVQAQIMRLLKRLQEELGLAVALITHDLGVISGFARDVVVMYGGQAMEVGPTAEVLRAPHNPYTWGLIRSIPHVLRKADRLTPIPGAPPTIDQQLTGCPFHPRCVHRRDDCGHVVPELLQDPDGAWSRCLLPYETRVGAAQEVRS